VVHTATHIPPVSTAWRAKAWAENDRLRREGTAILAAAAADAGASRLVKESVCFFYVPQGDAWIDEDAPLDEQPFSSATLDAERTAVAFGRDGDRVGVALRFGLFYSHDARALGESMTLAKRGMGPMIGRPEAFQPSIHVDDAATAIVSALDAPDGVYNVADEPITKGEWNAAFAEAFELGRSLRPTPKAAIAAGGKKMAVLAGSRRVSSARFRDATGWSPAHPDARIGLKAVAEAWRARAGAR
jgi:nucleoside-diphosphate-sugar epimerase